MDILLIILFIFIATFVYAGWSAAPWAPTRKADVVRFLKLANIKPGDKVFDLGCGDGRLLFAAAEKGAVVTGYEISLLPYIIAKIKQLSFAQKDKTPHHSLCLGAGQAKILFKDFWNVDLSDANIVYFFLMPKVYAKLRAKFEKELKPGTRIIAYVWPIDGWIPVNTSEIKGAQNIYLYEKK